MKNIGRLFLVSAILMIFGLQVQSQNNTTTAKQQDQQKTTVNPTCGTIVDNNKNVICDNFESRSAKGQGANFVDKDGDGICDNRANTGSKSANTCRNGLGNQYRHGQGQGKGQGRGYGNCCRR
jgi:hypothetical protein